MLGRHNGLLEKHINPDIYNKNLINDIERGSAATT